jgi:hypothetical protein
MEATTACPASRGMLSARVMLWFSRYVLQGEDDDSNDGDYEP